MDEGYIKFNCNLIQDAPLPPEEPLELNTWRDKLFRLGLIGVYPNGIGFGNISKRRDGQKFIVSGSATGGLERLGAEHYCLVERYSLIRNELTCRGQIKASSESLTHASIYEEAPQSNGIIHIHNKEMWEKLLGKVPTTRKEVPYGTPEMALEMKRLFDESDLKDLGILVMAGHEEGIIGFGRDLDEAGKIILGWHDKLGSVERVRFTLLDS